MFTEPKIFRGDAVDELTLTVQCTYENKTDQIVYGGTGSFDEMCFNFSYIAVQTGETPTQQNSPAGRE